MNLLVTILGVFAILVGLTGLISPRTLAAFVQSFDGTTRFRFAVALRLIIGAALILVAPACRVPLLVRSLGGIAILAAVIILVAGQKRLDETIAWWLKSLTRVRSSSLFAIAMGVLIIYAAGW